MRGARAQAVGAVFSPPTMAPSPNSPLNEGSVSDAGNLKPRAAGELGQEHRGFLIGCQPWELRGSERGLEPSPTAAIISR